LQKKALESGHTVEVVAWNAGGAVLGGARLGSLRAEDVAHVTTHHLAHLPTRAATHAALKTPDESLILN